MNSIVNNDVLNLINYEIPWNKLEHKTVLITGATGFIGSFLVNTLLTRSVKYASDIKVLAVVRNKRRASEIFAEYEDAGLIEYFEQDVCTPLPTDKRADYIIHCASNAAPKEYGSDPVGTMKTNFFGTLNLLDYAKEVKCKKFLYVSTIEVYGTNDIDGKINEADYGYLDACNVRSCYPISKKACETLCVSYADQWGIDVSIGRLSYIFGPGMKKGDSKIAALFPYQVANNQDIVMKSKGEQLRSYTYISDAISGLLTVLLLGENKNAYNIASKLCITTIANIAETLVSLYPEKGLKVVFDLPSENEAKAFSPIRNSVLNSEKLEKLGWKAQIGLSDGLRNVVEEQTLLISQGED